MSLIAWLPLTNNLNNQGASNMSFTSVSATQNTFGKIGKSYTFGTSSSGARLYSELFTPKTNSFSMCCWYKATEGNSTSGYIMGLSKAQTADFMLYKNGTTGFRIYSNGGNTLHTHGIDITKWHHLTLTNNGTTTTLYIDGVSVKTRSTPTDYTLAQYRLFLGCRSNHADTTGAGSGYSNTGHYNDFRFYDHCLSAAEVHEISLGLVQHYKLDDTSSESTTNYIPSPYKTSYAAATPAWDASKHPNAIVPNGWTNGYNKGVSEPATGYHAMWNIIDDIPTIIFQNHNSIIDKTNRWMGVSSDTIAFSIPANTKYTISYEQRTIDTLGGYTTCGLYYKYNSSASLGFHDTCPTIGKNTVLNQWQRFSYTFTRNSNVDGTGTNGYIYIYGNKGTESTMQIRNIQLEIKDHMTEYTISTRASGKICDSSGYGHSGTITGTLPLTYNTPRYSCATCGAANSYAATDYVFDSTNLSSEFTWTGWIYRTNTESTAGYLYSGTAVVYLYTNYDLRITWFQATEDSSATNTWATSQIMPLNTWTHTALTYKDGVLKVYVNGTYIKSDNRASTGTFIKGYKSNYLFSGSSGTSYYDGGLSDMRVYCTALSDADIKQLYELGAKIDNKNQWHAFEFQEGGTTAKIKKKGITLANEVFEDVNRNNTAQIIKSDAHSLVVSGLNVTATKDGIVQTGYLDSIPGATLLALKGKTLRLIYDAYAPGDRYSTEHGQTNWNEVRWGIHGDVNIVDGSGVSSYIYPFTNYLEYSGNWARLVDEWTIPSDYQSFGDLIFQIQTFDKPASTNTSTWYLCNARVEVVETTIYERVNASNLIEF